jgi:hypothetical protein
MNLYNKPKIEWDENGVLRFMGTYIWIEANQKMDNVYYTGIVSLSQYKSIDGDGERCFTDPYTDKEKCRAAIEKKCQDLIVQYTVGIELSETASLFAPESIINQGHIPEREASND